MKQDKLKSWDKAYLVVPRYILNRMFHSHSLERKVGFLFFTIFCNCYHSDGYVALKGGRYRCRRGDYIVTHTTLSSLTGIGKSYISSLLKKLVEENKITIEPLKGGSRIRVIGYDDLVKGKSADEKEKKSQVLTRTEAFARYIKAIQEKRYINPSDLY